MRCGWFVPWPVTKPRPESTRIGLSCSREPAHWHAMAGRASQFEFHAEVGGILVLVDLSGPGVLCDCETVATIAEKAAGGLVSLTRVPAIRMTECSPNANGAGS